MHDHRARTEISMHSNVRLTVQHIADTVAPSIIAGCHTRAYHNAAAPEGKNGLAVALILRNFSGPKDWASNSLNYFEKKVLKTAVFPWCLPQIGSIDNSRTSVELGLSYICFNDFSTIS